MVEQRDIFLCHASEDKPIRNIKSCCTLSQINGIFIRMLKTLLEGAMEL